MKSVALFIAILSTLFLTACQQTESPISEEADLPSKVPQLSVSASTQWDTSTQTLCWEECEHTEAAVNNQLSDLDNLADEAPAFQINGQSNITIDLAADVEPTRFSYTEYIPDSSNVVTQNIENGVIEVNGALPKTYIVQAEWYSEDTEKLLGSIYTIFTLES